MCFGAVSAVVASIECVWIFCTYWNLNTGFMSAASVSAILHDTFFSLPSNTAQKYIRNIRCNYVKKKKYEMFQIIDKMVHLYAHGPSHWFSQILWPKNYRFNFIIAIVKFYEIAVFVEMPMAMKHLHFMPQRKRMIIAKLGVTKLSWVNVFNFF